MSEFIIDQAIFATKSDTTKEYLREVISSYNNCNYRATIVGLYAVIIYDLLEKILLLRDVYSDSAAKDIIKSIEKSKEDNPNSPKWEDELLKSISERTELLNNVEYRQLLHIKDYRNLCAHPIYNQDYELINPSKDITRALLRSAFEIVFWKDAVLGKNVVSMFIKDINEYYDRMKTKGLEKHMKFTYLNRMPQRVKDIIFTSLWKFTFILDNEECNRNRLSNFWGIKYLMNEDPQHYIDLVDADKDRFSNITLTKEDIDYGNDIYSYYTTRIGALVGFLSIYEKVYHKLSDKAKNIISQEVSKNIYLKIRATFLSDTLKNHCEKVLKYVNEYCTQGNWFKVGNYLVVNSTLIDLFYTKAEERDAVEDYLEFLLRYFEGSCTYNSANVIFDYIFNYIQYFDEQLIYKLLKIMNENNQIYDNNNINEMVSKLNEYCQVEFNTTLDLSEYNKLA